jgi:hypothetical protein
MAAFASVCLSVCLSVMKKEMHTAASTLAFPQHYFFIVGDDIQLVFHFTMSAPATTFWRIAGMTYLQVRINARSFVRSFVWSHHRDHRKEH